MSGKYDFSAFLLKKYRCKIIVNKIMCTMSQNSFQKCCLDCEKVCLIIFRGSFAVYIYSIERK